MPGRIMTNITNDEPDLLRVLASAHDRARKVLHTALHVLRGRAANELTASVAVAVHHFLTFAEPLRELDEERLIFSALRAHGPRATIDAALRHDVDEHVALDKLRDDVAPLWQRVRDTPASLDRVREELLAKTENLAHLLDGHMAHEECVVFPLVAKYVPAEVQARVLAVLSRRQIDAAS